MISLTITNVVTAIFIAEGGIHTVHPYGIMHYYQHTTPLQACYNTVQHRLAEYPSHHIDHDFILFLSNTYCPISSDPVGNCNWRHNVLYTLHL